MMIRPVNKARAMQLTGEKQIERKREYRVKFEELVEKPLDEQTEHFIKSFIFALGDDWKQVAAIASKFKKYLGEQNESKDLSPIQASDFLQKSGKTRTAMQRKEELEDIDLDKNNRIGLTEYLLLHYKMMILTEYFKRHEIAPTVSMENDGVGLTGVADMIIEELFTMPQGLDPEIEAAIEDFMKSKKAKEAKIAELENKAALGGVKGLAAKNELAQMNAADSTGENRVEVTLKAAQRRASKFSAAQQLEKKRQAEEEALQQKRRASRANLQQKAAKFSGNATAKEEAFISRHLEEIQNVGSAFSSKACGSFDIDVTAKEFGTCKCGHKKNNHHIA